MKFNEYSEAVEKTIQYPPMSKLMYPALGLTGEAGEVADKIKKIYRDRDGVFTDKDHHSIIKELGDILWYINAAAREIGCTLDDIAQCNIDKLHKRMELGVLGGSGDDREEKEGILKYYSTLDNLKHALKHMGTKWDTEMSTPDDFKHVFKPTIGGVITWYSASNIIKVRGSYDIQKRLIKNIRTAIHQ